MTKQVKHTSFNTRMVSRGKGNSGKSSVKKASYIGGRKLTEQRPGENSSVTYNYLRKSPEVVFSKILAPVGSPSWVYDPNKLWNAVEASENRKDSQTARELIIAFPIELQLEQRTQLINEYIQTHFVSQGMIADINMHEIPHNPHVHVLLTTRKLSPEGNFGNKEREWNKRQLLMEWRKHWKELCNQYLDKNGFNVEISEQSYKASNIVKIPTLHIGTNQDRHFKEQLNKHIKSVNTLIKHLHHNKLSINKTSFFKLHDANEQIEASFSKIENLLNDKQVKRKLKELSERLAEIKVKIFHSKNDELQFTNNINEASITATSVITP